MLWWRWFSRCRKKFPARRTATSSARAASCASKKPKRMRLLLWPLPSSTTNSSTNSARRELGCTVHSSRADPCKPAHNVSEITNQLCPFSSALPIFVLTADLHLHASIKASKLWMYGDGHPRLRKESSMKISRQSWYAGVLGIILLLGVGCARKLDDAKMSSEIQSKFSQDSGLASTQLTVQANNGVVTLSGSVDSAAQRDAAAQQDASVGGVKAVMTNVQVGSAVAGGAPP